MRDKRSGGRRLPAPPILVIIAYLLLGSAWLVGNPPGAAPDEPSHYLKALAAGRGELYLGSRLPQPADVEQLTDVQRWHQTTSRVVSLPGRLDPVGLPCNAFHPEVSAGCLTRLSTPPGDIERPTIVGPYQPFTYVLPGALMRFAGDPGDAVRLGRAGFWLCSAVFVALATLLLWSPDEGGCSLVGLLIAVTPAVVFASSSLSANGLEITAGLCFMAAVVRLARDPGPSRWVWAAVGTSGAVLPLARATGLIWVPLGSLVLVALVGARPALDILRRSGRLGIVAITVVAVGMTSSLAWEMVAQPHPARGIGAAARYLPGEVRELPEMLDQAIGVFGWLDTAMWRPAYLFWKGMLLGLIVLALLVGRRRDRAVMAGLVLAAIAVTLTAAVLNRPTGFGAQGRYVLPFLVIVPLVAGELVFGGTRRRRLRPRFLPLVVAGGVAVVHAGAWYANARRHAIGVPGRLLFLGRSEWEPPLGWVLWIVVVGLGAVCLVVSGLVTARSAHGQAAGDAGRAG